MDLIKLLDIANPKTIKDTINAMIGITGTANTNASNAVTTANEAKMLSQTAATNSASAKQTAEEALAIIEEADNRSEEASLLAEQAIADADDAVDTAELALNTANAARSAVDQALDLGQIGSFVHNTSGIALIHAYMTDNVNQTDDTTLDRYYVATPKLVRDALASYMNKVNPTATGSFSLNRSANSVVGDKSSTFGNGNVASGSASHAEGYATQATGNSSHAEGSATQATGNNSHAEGFFTEANDECSHAEGYDSVANGAFSHAEGGSTANGYYSHAEGLETVATHRSQHVFGELNIEDSNSASADNRGDYVEIVGNGQVVNNQLIRSNARTLDWEGNEWLAGNLTFATGKTAKVPTPTANEDAVPKSYVDNTTSIHTLWTGSVTSGEITLSENFSNYNILYFKLGNSNNEINTAVILSEDFNDTSISLPFDIIGKGSTEDRYFNIYKSANNKITVGSHLNLTLKSVKGGY